MIEWKGRTHTKIATHCPLLSFSEDWNHVEVSEWGTYTVPAPEHVLIDEAFLIKHPSVLKSLVSRKTPTKPVLKPAKRRAPPPVPKKKQTPAVRKAPGRPKLIPKPQSMAKVLPKLVPVEARRSTRISVRT